MNNSIWYWQKCKDSLHVADDVAAMLCIAQGLLEVGSGLTDVRDVLKDAANYISCWLERKESEE